MVGGEGEGARGQSKIAGRLLWARTSLGDGGTKDAPPVGRKPSQRWKPTCLFQAGMGGRKILLFSSRGRNSIRRTERRARVGSARRVAARLEMRSPRRASTSPHGGRPSWSPRGVSAAAAPLISLQRVCGSCGRQQGVSWPLRPRAALPLADRAPCSRSQRRLLACVSASATGNGGSSALLTLPGLASLMHARRVDPAKIWAARSVPSWHNLRLVYQRGIWPCG